MIPQSLLNRLSSSLVCSLRAQRGVHHHMERHDLQRYLGIRRSNPAKANRNTHVNERIFRKLRGKKTVAMNLLEYEDSIENLPPDRVRIELLKRGINPYKDVSPRTWQEAQITNTSFYAVIDPYVTPEEKLPILTNQLGASISAKSTEFKEQALHQWHNWRNGTRRMKRKEGFENFSAKTFGPTAEHIYIESHKALMERDRTKLLKFITEHAYQKMWPDVEEGSIKWELEGVLEPHKIVSVRCSDLPYNSGNDIAQITVRMHTKQKLAIFDRFGKLLLGSETQPREIVEYVVFENHIAVIDGSWRLHDKVYPRWMKPKQAALNTTYLKDGDERPTNATTVPLRIADEIEKSKKADKEKET